jgi:pimeloyl-ACP methyl ester carboxylesterase
MFKSRFFTFEGLQIHYTEWGTRGSPGVVMWHGFGRNCRDFDRLAAHMAGTNFCVCIDTPGRGLSSWSPTPKDHYRIDFLAKVADAFVNHVFGADGPQVDWVGTSMGGLVGMHAAATVLKTRIRKLILNDVGPTISKAAVERISKYSHIVPVYDTLAEMEAFFRQVYAPFGPTISDDQWMEIAITSSRRTDKGKWTVHYDPEITFGLKDPSSGDTAALDSWEQYRQVTCPMLLIWGELSDLLLPEHVEKMKAEGPQLEVAQVMGVGHAPPLNVPEHFELVTKFFAS